MCREATSASSSVSRQRPEPIANERASNAQLNQPRQGRHESSPGRQSWEAEQTKRSAPAGAAEAQAACSQEYSVAPAGAESRTTHLHPRLTPLVSTQVITPLLACGAGGQHIAQGGAPAQPWVRANPITSPRSGRQTLHTHRWIVATTAAPRRLSPTDVGWMCEVRSHQGCAFAPPWAICCPSAPQAQNRRLNLCRYHRLRPQATVMSPLRG